MTEESAFDYQQEVFLSTKSLKPFLRAKRSGHEAEYSVPSSVKIKIAWIHTSHFTIHLGGVVLSGAGK